MDHRQPDGDKAEAELAGALEKFPQNFLHSPLQDAAVQWAEHALRNHRDEHLRKALAISTAIVDYVALLERG